MEIFTPLRFYVEVIDTFMVSLVIYEIIRIEKGN